MDRFSGNVPLVIAIDVPTDIPWAGFLDMLFVIAIAIPTNIPGIDALAMSHCDSR